MKAIYLAMMVVAMPMEVHAADVSVNLQRRADIRAEATEWERIEKITRAEARRRGTDQHVYFFYMGDGKQRSGAVNATANPILHSYLYTAYLTGTPVDIKREGSGFIAEVRLMH